MANQIIDRLLYGIGLDTASFQGDASKIARTINFLGKEAKTTFERDFGRSLAKSIDPKNFQADLNKARQVINNFGRDAQATFQRTLGTQISKGFFNANKEAGGFFQTLISGSSQLSRFHALLASGIFSGIIAGKIVDTLASIGSAAVKMAVDLEYSLAKVSTIADKEINLDAIKQSLLDLSGRLPETAVSLTEGLFSIIGSGIRETDDALKVLEVSSKAAVAGVSNTQEAAKAIVFLMNAYNLSAEDASHISDVLFKTVDEGVVSFSELASQIGEVAATAALAGISIEDIGAAFAVSTKNGINAAETATSLKNAILSVIAPIKEAGIQARSMGLNFSKAGIDAAGGWVGFVKLLSDATKGDLKKLESLFPEKRALREMAILTGTAADEFQRLGEIVNDVANLEGATEVAFSKMNKTADAQWKIFKNNLNAEMIAFGDTLLKVVKPGLSAINTSMQEGNAEASRMSALFAASPMAGAIMLIKKSYDALYDSASKAADAQKKVIGGGGGASTNKPTGISSEETGLLDVTKLTVEQLEKIVNKKKELQEIDVQNLENAREELRQRKHAAEEAERDRKKALEFIDKARGEIKQVSAESEVEKRLEAIRQEAAERRKMFKEHADALAMVYALERAEIRKVLQARDAITQKELDKVAKQKGQFDPVKGLSLIGSVPVVVDPFGELKKFNRPLQDALAEIGEPIASFIIDLENSGIRIADLAEFGNLIDKNLGDFISSLGKFKDAIAEQNIFGTVNSLIAGFGALGGLLKELGASPAEEFRRQKELDRQQRRLEDAQERARRATDKLRESFEKLNNAIPSTGIGELELELRAVQERIAKLMLLHPRRRPHELDFLQERERLLQEAIANFGVWSDDFSDLVEKLNLEFGLLDVEDPIRKLDRFRTDIKKQFGALIPDTEAQINELIKQGLGALLAGGDALKDFLKGIDLEELTADQFRDFLEFLKGLADDAKAQADAIEEIDNEIGVSAVKAITFNQGNQLINEVATIREILTQWDSGRGNLASINGAITARTTGNSLFFFIKDGAVTQINPAQLESIDRSMIQKALQSSRSVGVV